MDEIKAFVGHSFAEEDEQVVGAVLKYLKTVSELYPNFSWEHAEDPEPKGIDEKVLQRFQNKNLFIGICTRKELVATHSNPCWWPFNKHVISAPENLVWKTSDWIIQEVGMAVGRGMNVILLVEEGVRQPGGIQGVLEYIPIQRDAPEASFTKLLAMLATLTPKVPSASTEADAISVPPPTPKAEEATEKAAADWKTPKAEWSRSAFGFAMLNAVFNDDIDSEKLINAKFLSSALAGTEESLRRWKAECNFWHLKHGDASCLTVLRDLAKKEPPDAEVVALLAQSYVDLGEYASAAVEFERASKDATANATRRLELIGLAAISSHRAGNDPQARIYADRIREVASVTPEVEQTAVDAMRNLAEALGETEILIGTLERLLALNPTDVQTRFALAFKYGEQDRYDLAAHHYLRIPERARDGGAWNNLGWIFEELKLPVKSVHAYRRAEAAGETLAVSNLANRFLLAGFLPEATNLLEAAAQVPGHHKNVDSSLNRAKTVESNEQIRADELLQKALPVSDFYRHFGEAASRSMAAPLNGAWASPTCSLEVVQEGGAMRAVGTYSQPAGGLLGLGMVITKQSGTPDLAHAPSMIEVKYQGKVQGCVVVGTMTVRRLGAAQTESANSLLNEPDRTSVLMWLSSDGARLSIMERTGTSTPKFYDIVRA